MKIHHFEEVGVPPLATRHHRNDLELKLKRKQVRDRELYSNPRPTEKFWYDWIAGALLQAPFKCPRPLPADDLTPSPKSPLCKDYVDYRGYKRKSGAFENVS